MSNAIVCPDCPLKIVGENKDNTLKVEYNINGEILTCMNCGFSKQRCRDKDAGGYMRLGAFGVFADAKFCPKCGVKLKRA